MGGFPTLVRELFGGSTAQPFSFRSSGRFCFVFFNLLNSSFECYLFRRPVRPGSAGATSCLCSYCLPSNGTLEKVSESVDFFFGH